MRWHLALARSLAWALLLTGWVGLAAVAQRYSAGTAQTFGVLALWLVVLGFLATLLGRFTSGAAARRVALIASAVLAATALTGSLSVVPWASLVVAALAWAALLALASCTVRACRLQSRRPGPPVVPAAVGALLAWLLLGDIGDPALPLRLALGALFAAMVLAALHPAALPSPARAACRAGLFDCSLPAWSAGAWRDTPRWPLRVASLVMLPMMCSLSLMLDLCRGAALNGQAMLGLHLAAMFLPALWWGTRRAAPTVSASTTACAVLLGAGAVALMAAPGDLTWALLALLQGGAWSLAWAVSLGEHRPAASPSPLSGALLNAAAVLALGWAIDRFGLAALSGVHIALGLAAWLAWSAAQALRTWQLRRQNAAFRQEPTAV